MSNIHVLNLSAYTAPTIEESKRDAWVNYDGADGGSYYQFLIDRYTNSTTNNAIINNISRLIYGKGVFVWSFLLRLLTKTVWSTVWSHEWCSVVMIVGLGGPEGGG